jgi:iron(II)-dependent oxidoreductase
MARQLIADGRYAFLLLPEAVSDVSKTEAKPAWNALADAMAIVPQGVVPIYTAAGTLIEAQIDAFYIDRHAVTNRQYQRFVDAGGYDSLEIWPKEIWPSVMKLTDRTHRPGPRGWENGKHPVGKADHPVVGVSWYEAVAYSSWVGKRLPTALEWQKAGGWPEQLTGGSCLRYPWGNVYEPDRANLWSSGHRETVPVDEYRAGATPNGIFQMVGNVWEWLSDVLNAIPCRPGESFQVWRPTRRIAGGAFDTYFPAEATCHFVTGQPELDRRDNIGFRCAISAARLRDDDGEDRSID